VISNGADRETRSGPYMERTALMTEIVAMLDQLSIDRLRVNHFVISGQARESFTIKPALRLVHSQQRRGRSTRRSRARLRIVR
jgi:hypothetical protein